MPPSQAPRIANSRWFIYYLSQHRFATFMAIATGSIGGITDSLQPYVVGVIVDHLSNGVDIQQIMADIGLLVAFSFITLIAFFGQRHYSGVVAYETNYDMRRDIFANMVTLDQSFYERYSIGDLISRVYSDLQFVWRVLAIGMNRGGSAITGLVFTFLLLGSVNLLLTVIVFVVLFVSTSFQMLAGLAITPLSEKVQDQQGVISSLVQDTASGIQTLKSFGREADVARAFYAQNVAYRRIWLYFKRRNEPVGMLPQAISQLAAGVVVVLGGFLTLRGQMTLGNFTQFLLYLSFVSKSLLEIGTIYQRAMQTRGALKRVTPLLQEALIKDDPHAKSLTNPKGEIHLEHLSYRVGDRWILRDINLHIPQGTVVAIVGATGCGKTTLVNCLARVMDVTEGAVKIDGIPVQDIKLNDLRQAIAYVPQSTFLFSLPLHENIRMGKPDIRNDELQQAVHISRISNDLPQLPNGLDTLVGEKGVMLSGGQKQRVAIARAIARNPAILVLDDALSSVDTRTAADILADLRQVLKTRTSIIIAHRIATVKDADLILVMADGHIVEQGTHHSLIAQDGLYARMVERELQEEKPTEVTGD